MFRLIVLYVGMCYIKYPLYRCKGSSYNKPMHAEPAEWRYAKSQCINIFNVRNDMRKVFIFVVLFVLGCGQEKIHEYQVNMLADDMKKAVEERDADKLHALFSEDAFIEVTFPKEMGGTKQLPLNRYIDDIRKGWSMGIDQRDFGVVH